MEIDITDFYNNADTRQFSNSIANSGQANIGRITWENAQKSDYIFIDTEEKRAALLKHLEDAGMEDVWKHDMRDANALFIQLVSGDIQEKGDATWTEYQKESENGQVSGRLFEGVDRRIYYSLS